VLAAIAPAFIGGKRDRPTVTRPIHKSSLDAQPPGPCARRARSDPSATSLQPTRLRPDTNAASVTSASANLKSPPKCPAFLLESATLPPAARFWRSEPEGPMPQRTVSAAQKNPRNLGAFPRISPTTLPCPPISPRRPMRIARPARLRPPEA